MKIFACLGAVAMAVCAMSQSPEVGAHLPSQAAADVLKEFAGTDGAFLAAGLVKRNYSKAEDLSSLIEFPSDEIVVVTITGAQVKLAFERSLSLYPQENTSFLQVSGFEVSFSKSASAGQRILSVKCNGLPLEESKNYQIAMPSSLGRGGLGYFKIWDKAKITKTFEKATMDSILKGKRYVETALRWLASSS